VREAGASFGVRRGIKTLRGKERKGLSSREKKSFAESYGSGTFGKCKIAIVMEQSDRRLQHKNLDREIGTEPGKGYKR